MLPETLRPPLSRLGADGRVYGLTTTATTQTIVATPVPWLTAHTILRFRFSQDSQAGGGSALGGSATDGRFHTSGAGDTLAMLMNHCRSSQEGKAFLYDELALSAATGALGSDALDALVNMLLGANECW